MCAGLVQNLYTSLWATLLVLLLVHQSATVKSEVVTYKELK